MSCCEFEPKKLILPCVRGRQTLSCFQAFEVEPCTQIIVNSNLTRKRCIVQQIWCDIEERFFNSLQLCRTLFFINMQRFQVIRDFPILHAHKTWNCQKSSRPRESGCNFRFIKPNELKISAMGHKMLRNVRVNLQLIPPIITIVIQWWIWANYAIEKLCDFLQWPVLYIGVYGYG